MILGEDNRKKWSEMDVLIMLGYEQYKREHCHICNQPIWLCNNDDPRLQARKKVRACWIDQQVEDWRENPQNGEEDAKYIQPEIYSRDDTPLHEFREPYFESKAREAAEEAEGQD